MICESGGNFEFIDVYSREKVKSIGSLKEVNSINDVGFMRYSTGEYFLATDNGIHFAKLEQMVI